MGSLAQQAAGMIDLLPESDQLFAIEFVKKLVQAWDPDFTKVTPDEYKAIMEAEQEMLNGEYVTHSEIDW